MVYMKTEQMLEKLSRFNPTSRQEVTWAWCLKKRQSRKILKTSEKACRIVPGLTVTVIPEPISWYPNAKDPFTGDPILIPAWRRVWWGLRWSGYECHIIGEARQIQTYLRTMKDLLNAD